MDTFRADVKKAMNGVSPSTTPSTPVVKEEEVEKVTSYPKVPFLVTVLIPDLNYRATPSLTGTVKGQTGKGSFTITQVSGEWGKLKSGAGWINIARPDYVKIGKSVQQTASNIPAPTTYRVRVEVDALNIRAGAGTNYKVTGVIRGKGVYTIVETKGNWGKLKSGAGWICLDYVKKLV